MTMVQYKNKKMTKSRMLNNISKSNQISFSSQVLFNILIYELGDKLNSKLDYFYGRLTLAFKAYQTCTL